VTGPTGHEPLPAQHVGPPGVPGTVLRVPRCRRCHRSFWYPRARCPFCRSDDIEQVDSPGTGTLYTYSTVPARKKPPADVTGDRILAYVQLDEGPFVLTSIVGLSSDELWIGMPLTALPSEGDVPLHFGAPPGGLADRRS
jgi:uncharacterized protein